DPRTTGRGGAAFSSLSTAAVISLATPLPLASRVVLDSRPFIQPLLELLDEGRPAGVVLASTRAAELLDWRLGDLRRLTRVTREFADDAAERPGPIVASAAGSRFVTRAGEQRSRRERDRQRRWLEQ